MDDARIEVLERRVRRLHRFTIMLAVGYVLLLTWRLVPGPHTLEAEAFVMRDGQGAVRGALTMLDDGRPILRLNDSNGKARAMLILNASRGGGLRLFDLNGERRVTLDLKPDGVPELRLHGADGDTRTLLTLGNRAKPGLTLLDESGELYAAPPR